MISAQAVLRDINVIHRDTNRISRHDKKAKLASQHKRFRKELSK